MLLTEIHRQAWDNPIIRYAYAVRTGQTIPYGDDGAARKINRLTADPSELINGGQLLTGMNKTRQKLNLMMRKELGFEGTYPTKGERLVCLRNDKDLGIMNGVVCTSLTDSHLDEDEERMFMISVMYEDRQIPLLPVCKFFFDLYNQPNGNPDDFHLLRDRVNQPMDFGYALTVHKSQGSQWDVVTLCDDGFAKRTPSMRQKWRYTAITRAAHKLTIVA